VIAHETTRACCIPIGQDRAREEKAQTKESRPGIANAKALAGHWMYPIVDGGAQTPCRSTELRRRPMFVPTTRRSALGGPGGDYGGRGRLRRASIFALRSAIQCEEIAGALRGLVAAVVVHPAGRDEPRVEVTGPPGAADRGAGTFPAAGHLGTANAGSGEWDRTTDLRIMIPPL
jgi:hypothetical protein